MTELPPGLPAGPASEPPPGLPAGSAAAPPEPRGFISRLRGLLNPLSPDRVRRRKGTFTPPFVTMQDGRRRKPRVLFVDAGNATRSQMAEAFANARGFHAESAGTFPSPAIPTEVVTVMEEKGHDLSGAQPALVDLRRLEAFDRVVMFDTVLPEMYRRSPNVEAWNLLDPQGFPVEGYRMVRDQAERLVERLAQNWMRKVKEPDAKLAA